LLQLLVLFGLVVRFLDDALLASGCSGTRGAVTGTGRSGPRICNGSSPHRKAHLATRRSTRAAGIPATTRSAHRPGRHWRAALGSLLPSLEHELGAIEVIKFIAQEPVARGCEGPAAHRHARVTVTTHVPHGLQSLLLSLPLSSAPHTARRRARPRLLTTRAVLFAANAANARAHHGARCCECTRPPWRPHMHAAGSARSSMRSRPLAHVDVAGGSLHGASLSGGCPWCSSRLSGAPAP